MRTVPIPSLLVDLEAQKYLMHVLCTAKGHSNHTKACDKSRLSSINAIPIDSKYISIPYIVDSKIGPVNHRLLSNPPLLVFPTIRQISQTLKKRGLRRVLRIYIPMRSQPFVSYRYIAIS